MIHRILGVGLDEGQKLLVELVRLHLEFLADHRGGLFARAEIVQHGEQRIPAEFVVDVIADPASLKITDDDLRRRHGWTKPRSSSAMGSSFLFLMAPITS